MTVLRLSLSESGMPVSTSSASHLDRPDPSPSRVEGDIAKTTGHMTYCGMRMMPV